MEERENREVMEREFCPPSFLPPMTFTRLGVKRSDFCRFKGMTFYVKHRTNTILECASRARNNFARFSAKFLQHAVRYRIIRLGGRLRSPNTVVFYDFDGRF